MKVKFYVLNHDANVYSCYITDKNDVNKCLISHKSKSNANEPKILISPYLFHIFLNEINNCDTYRLSAARYFQSFSSSPYLIKILPTSHEFIDYVWGEIVRILVWEQIEADHMFSWLSTLGGAFSALGDYFEDRAEIAGKISIHQMRLALRLGDPTLISRCKLFFSISLMQRKRLKLAQFIIRQQYEFAISNNDTRLWKMCMGIWSKLQYTHMINRKNRKLGKNLENDNANKIFIGR